MASVRIHLALVLILSLWTGAAHTEDRQNPPQLYDRPVLVVDPGTHTGAIMSASADRDGRWAVTGSLDKTVRIWSLADGKLERTIRLPEGPGDVGKVYAVAMSRDGALIAAGGWARWSDADRQGQIYLFDRANGTLVKRIDGLPGNVDSLVFTQDGSRLAAGLSSGGLRIYQRSAGWAEAARDEDYGDQINGIDFAVDDRLATTSYDGKVRLYAPSASGEIRPVAVDVPGKEPFRIAFNPTGARLAVGHHDAARVDVLDARSLAKLTSPDVTGVEDVSALSVVAWSRDGERLVAGGTTFGRAAPLFFWSQSGAGARRLVAETKHIVQALVALSNGDLLAAEGTFLVRIGPDGTRRWAQQTLIAEADGLAVSADGSRVAFGYEFGGAGRARFDLDTRTLTQEPNPESGMATPRQSGLNVESWMNSVAPTLDGKALRLERYETSHSLAIHPSGKSFVLGTDWSLRAYDAQGDPLWSRHVPGEVWAVNITGDGRLVVAAHGDGTIRWYRMMDGAELLAFMPLADRINWMAWTPEGFYAATAGGQGVLRWHVNRGWEPGDSVPVEDIPGSYRPELLPLVLQENETPRAVGLAVLAEHNRQVMLRTESNIPRGAQLLLLAIGIDQYNEEYAKNLRLHFADRDAHDLASAIVNTQSALYLGRGDDLRTWDSQMGSNRIQR